MKTPTVGENIWLLKDYDTYDKVECKMSEQWEEGNNAFYDGLDVSDCPYPEASDEATEWVMGWECAQSDGDD